MKRTQYALTPPNAFQGQNTAAGRPINNSRGILGGSGSGKSTSAAHDLIPHIGRLFTVVFDRSATTATRMWEHVYDRPNVIIDDLSAERVFPVDMIPLPQGDGFASERRWRRTKDTLLSLMAEEQGQLIKSQPVKLEWADALLDFYRLSGGGGFDELMLPCQPWRPDWNSKVLACPNPALRAKFLDVKRLHPSTRSSTVGAAERMVAQFLGDPCVRVRWSRPTVTVDDLVERRATLIIVGGPEASRHAFRLVCSLWTDTIVNYAERRGEDWDVPINVVYEEVFRDQLWNDNTLRGLTQGRKHGLSSWFVSQEFPDDPAVREQWANSLGSLYLHRCQSPQMAEFCADLMSGMLDPYKTHSTTERVMRDGEFIENTPIRSYNSAGLTTWSAREQVRGRYRTVEDTKYMSLSDQRTMLISDIQQLAVGERFVIDGRIRRERVTPLPPKWPWPSVNVRRMHAALQAMRQSDFFIDATWGGNHA